MNRESIYLNKFDFDNRFSQGPELNYAEIKEIIIELELMGVDSMAFVDSWERSHSSLRVAVDHSLPVMHELEKRYKGSCKILNENFKIWNFGRYHPDVLSRQIEQMDTKDMPYGILVTALNDVSEESSEWSDSYFDQSWLDGIKNLSDQLIDEKTGVKYALRIGECENLLELARLMNFFKNQYGKHKRANFGIFSGHGNIHQLSFGDGLRPINYLTTSDLSDFRFLRYRNVFTKSAVLVIDSCDTGADGGFAEELSQNFAIEVMAPMGKSSLENVRVGYKDEKFINLDTSYSFGTQTKICVP